MSQALTEARLYEEAQSRTIPDAARPGFHLSPRVGWMNDPNGLSWYGGQYHLFYQYHPYDTHWGSMHWGHAVSADLLRWRYLPAALAPDAAYDQNGCFSGSALALPDGRHLLMYTGVARETLPDGGTRDVQTQNLAFGDGENYEKYAHNPILSARHLPEGGSRFDFRDPKIWQDPDGGYRAVVANDHPGHGGQILLFKSDDLRAWQLERVLAKNDGRLGRMWECPDFFALDGQYVLLSSAQDMLPVDLEYHNGNGTFCMLGHLDESGAFIEESNQAIDYGIDFFAPQTLLTPDGRRVMIGWMQNWDTCNQRSHDAPWFGQMTLPRELSIRNEALFQRPIRELDALRGDRVEYAHVKIENGEIALPGVCGRMVDMEIELEPGEELFERFVIRFARDDRCHTSLGFRPRESVLTVDRRFSGSRRDILHQRRARVNHDHGRLKLRLILDRFSAEVFVNDGEKVLSTTFYTDLSADAITFCADGRLSFSVRCYPLEI